MSIHRSLRGIDTLTGQRSVYKRIERIQALLKEEKMSADDSPYGLPKVRTAYKVKSAKKKAKAEETDETAAEEGEEKKAE